MVVGVKGFFFYYDVTTDRCLIRLRHTQSYPEKMYKKYSIFLMCLLFICNTE